MCMSSIVVWGNGESQEGVLGNSQQQTVGQALHWA
jgi:hypothetical protein